MGIVNGKVVKVISPPRCVREGIWVVDTFVNVNGNELQHSISGHTKLNVMSKSKVGANVELEKESLPVFIDVELNTISSITITRGTGNQHKPIEHDNSFLRKELVDFFKENPPIPLNYIVDDSKGNL